MLRLGFITGFTKSGFSKQDNGPIPEMLLGNEQALFEASAFGMTYDTRPLSTAMVLGQRTRVGTGMVELTVDRSNYEDPGLSDQEASLRYLIRSGELTTLGAEELEDEFWSQAATTVYAYEKKNGQYASEFGSNLEFNQSVVLEEPSIVDVVPAAPLRLKPEATTEFLENLMDAESILPSVTDEDSIIQSAFPGGDTGRVTIRDQFSYNELEENTEYEYPDFDQDEFFS
jgi:hypothetical protein